MNARLIWSKRAVERFRNGKRDPMHTISAPNIAEVYDGFVRQLRPGTPWLLVDDLDRILDSGTAGVTREVVL